jgi:hypothetical protein
MAKVETPTEPIDPMDLEVEVDKFVLPGDIFYLSSIIHLSLIW